MHDALTVVLGILSLSVVVIGGFVKFLYSCITELRLAQNSVNDDLRKEMTNFVGELRQAMNIQTSDHRLAQHNLWAELRRISDKNSDEHTRVAEKIGLLATRDELAKVLEATEARIMETLRKEVPHR